MTENNSIIKLNSTKGKIFVAIIFTVAIAIAAVPLVNSKYQAAAVSKPGKVKISSCTADANYVQLKWKKPSNTTGYVIYRDGVEIFRTSSKSFVDTCIEQGKAYTYYVQAYRKYKTKQTVYLNTQTGAYQTAKPDKSIRGSKKKIKITKYKYGNLSDAKSIATITPTVIDANGGIVSDEYDSIRNEILAMVNQQRANVGLPALVMDPQMNGTAQAKAQDMYNTNQLSHYSTNLGTVSDQLNAVGYTYVYASENIAWGQQSVESVMSAWMSSEPHRNNILNESWNRIGIGYYNNRWVQQFANVKE